MGRPPMVENWVAGIISWLPELFWLIFKRFFLVINTIVACFLFNHVPNLSRAGSSIGWFLGSCWIARPSNGSHLATGWPLIHSIGNVPPLPLPLAGYIHKMIPDEVKGLSQNTYELLSLKHTVWARLWISLMSTRVAWWRQATSHYLS